MTLLRAARPREGVPPGTRHYLDAFITQVHQLVATGYQKLTPTHLATKEETAITGLLVLAIRQVIEGEEGPSWACRFAVHDDPPIDTGDGREGKNRSRLDIQFERTQSGKHPRFQFEAKRLNHRSDSVAMYVGGDGLGAFVSGTYAADEHTVGMLGYVQSQAPSDWIPKITAKLERDRASYGLPEVGDALRQVDVAATPLSSYESMHQRPTSNPVRVIHTLLECC